MTEEAMKFDSTPGSPNPGKAKASVKASPSSSSNPKKKGAPGPNVANDPKGAPLEKTGSSEKALSPTNHTKMKKPPTASPSCEPSGVRAGPQNTQPKPPSASSRNSKTSQPKTRNRVNSKPEPVTSDQAPIEPKIPLVKEAKPATKQKLTQPERKLPTNATINESSQAALEPPKGTNRLSQTQSLKKAMKAAPQSTSNQDPEKAASSPKSGPKRDSVQAQKRPTQSGPAKAPLQASDVLKSAIAASPKGAPPASTKAAPEVSLAIKSPRQSNRKPASEQGEASRVEITPVKAAAANPATKPGAVSANGPMPAKSPRSIVPVPIGTPTGGPVEPTQIASAKPGSPRPGANGAPVGRQTRTEESAIRPGAVAATGGQASSAKGRWSTPVRTAGASSSPERSAAGPMAVRPGAQAVTGVDVSSRAKGLRSPGVTGPRTRSPSRGNTDRGVPKSGAKRNRSSNTTDSGVSIRDQVVEPSVVAQRERQQEKSPMRVKSLDTAAVVGAHSSLSTTNYARRKKAGDVKRAATVMRAPVSEGAQTNSSGAVVTRPAPTGGSGSVAAKSSVGLGVIPDHDDGAHDNGANAALSPEEPYSNLIEAVLVDDSKQDEPPILVQATAAVDVYKDEDRQAEKRRLYFVLLLVLCCAAVFVVVGIVVAVVILQKNSAGSDTEGEPTVEQADREPLYDWFREVAVETILHENQVSVLDDEYSVYSLALYWIVFKDPLQLVPNSDQSRARQRYLMAVLYYAMSQDNGWKACNPIDENVAAASAENASVCNHTVLNLEGVQVDQATYSEVQAFRWLSGESECSWAGVTCNRNGDGSVVGIMLGGYDLTGRIPAEISWLSNLKELKLSMNSLGNGIPSDLGQLTAMSSLDLAGNTFEGVIPTELCELTLLHNLHLGANKLAGSIPACLGLLTNLVGLYLNENDLNGNVPDTLATLTKLEQFRIEKNRLGGRVPAGVCKLAYRFALTFFAGDCGENARLVCLCCNYCCTQGPTQNCLDVVPAKESDVIPQS